MIYVSGLPRPFLSPEPYTIAGLSMVYFKSGIFFSSCSTCSLCFATNVHGSPASSSLWGTYATSSNDTSGTSFVYKDIQNTFKVEYLLRAKIARRYLYVTRSFDFSRLLGAVKAQLVNSFLVHRICEAALCFPGTIEHVIDRLVGGKCSLAGSCEKNVTSLVLLSIKN